MQLAGREWHTDEEAGFKASINRESILNQSEMVSPGRSRPLRAVPGLGREGDKISRRTYRATELVPRSGKFANFDNRNPNEARLI
jgi:hypothetical protein